MTTVDDTTTDDSAPETADEHDGHDAHDDEHADHPSDGQYVIVALVLAVITALEVAASYIDLGPVFLPALLAMMAIKFIVVVRVFMHLKFDNKIFSWLFFTGLLLALFVYVAALLTFRFFEA